MPSQKRIVKNILLEREHFVGEVVDDKDPDKVLRVRVHVLGVTDGVPIDKLPWSIYWLPPGCRYNDGEFRPCKVGDMVWVDFPHTAHGEKDTRRPRITGSIHWYPGYIPEVPHEAFMKNRDEYKPVAPRTMGTEAEYHKSHVFTHNNTTMEFVQDGTWRIWNRENGTAIEITKDGDMKINSSQSLSIKADKDINIEAGGQLTLDGRGVRINPL